MLGVSEFALDDVLSTKHVRLDLFERLRLAAQLLTGLCLALRQHNLILLLCSLYYIVHSGQTVLNLLHESLLSLKPHLLVLLQLVNEGNHFGLEVRFGILGFSLPVQKLFVDLGLNRVQYVLHHVGVVVVLLAFLLVNLPLFVLDLAKDRHGLVSLLLQSVHEVALEVLDAVEHFLLLALGVGCHLLVPVLLLLQCVTEVVHLGLGLKRFLSVYL